MKKTVQIGVILALAAALIKLALFSGFEEPTARPASVAIYLLLLTVAVYWAMHQSRNTIAGFIAYLKTGLTAALFYVMVIFGFAFTYYGFVDPNYLEQKKIERLQQAEQFDLSKLDASNPKSKMTREEFIETEQKTAEVMFSPFVYATATLIGFLLYGIFAAIFLSVIMSRLLGDGQYKF